MQADGGARPGMLGRHALALRVAPDEEAEDVVEEDEERLTVTRVRGRSHSRGRSQPSTVADKRKRGRGFRLTPRSGKRGGRSGPKRPGARPRPRRRESGGA